MEFRDWASYDLTEETYHFFKAFDDILVPLCREMHSIQGKYDDLPEQVKPLAHHCLMEKISITEIRKKYNTVASMLTKYSDQADGRAHELLKAYPTAESFALRILIEEKLLLKKQNWQMSKIFMLDTE